MYRFRKDLEAKKAVEINVPHKKVMMCLNESTLNPLDAVKDQLLENLKSVPLNRYFNDITPKLITDGVDLSYYGPGHYEYVRRIYV